MRDPLLCLHVADARPEAVEDRPLLLPRLHQLGLQVLRRLLQVAQALPLDLQLRSKKGMCGGLNCKISPETPQLRFIIYVVALEVPHLSLEADQGVQTFLFHFLDSFSFDYLILFVLEYVELKF